MFINDYTPEEYAKVFDVSDGTHAMRIDGVRVCNAKSGKQMLEVYFAVEGAQTWYIERYVEGEYFNKNMTRLFDAFQMPRGDFDFTHWKGRTGFGTFEHVSETYTDSNGMPRTSNKSTLKRLEVPQQQQPQQPATPAQMGMQPASSLAQPQGNQPSF